MLTISFLKPQTIEAVSIRGLRATHPDQFTCTLWLTAEEKDATKIGVNLIDDRDMGESYVVSFDDFLPQTFIPQFLIDSKVFRYGIAETLQDAYGWALTMAVMATSEIKLCLSREEDEVLASLSIGAFVTKKNIPFRDIKDTFTKLKKK